MRKTSKSQKVKTSKWASPVVWRAVFALALAANVRAEGEAAPAKPEGSPPELVHRGNKLLLDEKPGDAIKLYDQAQQLAPDAREIAFGKGLSYYKMGDFENARAAFQEAGAAEDPALADDALYSIGTVDHAEALGAAQEDQKTAMSKLESAMQSYQGVLARNSEHAAARDANLKAATMWRQIKQQMQQQQQQQQNNQDQQENQEHQEQQQQQQDQQQQEKQQEQQSQQQDQEQQQQDQEQQQQEQQQQPEASQDEQQQDEQQQSSQEQQEQQEQQQSTEQQQEMNEEQVSREQAERQLREMLQALRDRKKERHEPAQPMPVQRGEKDW